jgi:hypothetical protein
LACRVFLFIHTFQAVESEINRKLGTRSKSPVFVVFRIWKGGSCAPWRFFRLPTHKRLSHSLLTLIELDGMRNPARYWQLIARNKGTNAQCTMQCNATEEVGETRRTNNINYTIYSLTVRVVSLQQAIKRNFNLQLTVLCL